MDVTIRHTKDGTPYARPYLGTSPTTGRKVRPYREFPGMTDEEAHDAALAWVDTLLAARAENSPTLAALVARYIDALEAGGHAPSTIATYRRVMRKHTGRLSRVRAANVTTEAVDTRIMELLHGGRGRAALSPQTVRLWRDVMHGAYRWAVSIGMAEYNPVDGAIRPRRTTPEARALSERDARRLHDALRDSATKYGTGSARATFAANAALCALIALDTGMRCGEVLALRNQDIGDPLGPPTLWVRGTITTADGRPRRQQTTKGHKPRAIAISNELRRIIGERMVAQYLDEPGCIFRTGRAVASSREGYVCTVDGSPMNPRSVSRWFTRYARAHGMPSGTTFHTLRHTHATMLLQAGVDAKTVQERLGHADVATTLRTYAHVMPARDAQAVRALDSANASERAQRCQR